MKKQRYQKSDSIKKLEDFVFSKIKEKYPHFPYPVKPSYRDDTANQLSKCIIDLISYNGFNAERINSTGQKINKNGTEKWVKGSSKRGTADIHATIKGKSVKVEIKIGSDKQSEVQKKYQADEERAGGTYLLVHNYDEFRNWFVEFLKK